MNNISSLRKAAGISQAELGKAIGVAQNTVSAWEKGVRQPDNSCLRLLAEYFSVSVDEVLGYSTITHLSEPLRVYVTARCIIIAADLVI